MLLTELPFYLYHIEEEPQCGDGALFHYTTLPKFLLIINDLTLLPSRVRGLNDLNEWNVHNMNMNENFMVLYDAQKIIKEDCRVISFCQNYDVHGYTQEGTNHPAMWAHYADNCNGVCLVIDKESFKRKNEAILKQYFYKFEDVEYSVFNTPDDDVIDYSPDSARGFIESNWEPLFFLKHKDWENEDEHRFFIMGYEGKLSIDGCIKHIALGSKLSQDNSAIKEILDKVVDPNSLCYRKFVPHSFVTVNYN
ncbi:MAG: DUF2971 domain-containing protein [Bacteroidales bacterium]|nr:DUF2971 domain-containing protein [Bacteroidales bacterium]